MRNKNQSGQTERKKKNERREFPVFSKINIGNNNHDDNSRYRDADLFQSDGGETRSFPSDESQRGRHKYKKTDYNEKYCGK